MKMPENQKSDNGLYEYEDNSYFVEAVDNNGVEEFEVSPDDDFSEYLWMENEEEFDKEVLQRLEEEALMEQCIEAMLNDEHNENNSNSVSVNSNNSISNLNDASATNEISNMINHLKLDCEVVKGSNLNPLAAEFVPSGVRSTTNPSTTQESAVTVTSS